jgi:hypothetical protein
MRQSILHTSSLLLVAACLAGCGGDRGPERTVVSGTVTYNGKPLTNGSIRFMPTATSAVPMAGAGIKDGAYKVEGHGGVPVGTHKVEIEAYRVDPKYVKPEMPMSRGVPRTQYIPKRYNTDSNLQITIEPGSSQITKNFDLTD